MNIKLNMFEGPLDLLLHLVDKAEVDICEVPISCIANQFLKILNEASELELDVASDFLLMAATLISIKSRMLLPVDLKQVESEGDEFEWLDPREELVGRLLEYKRYKRLSGVLSEREENRNRVYSRLPMDVEKFAIEENWMNVLSPDELLNAFVSLFTSQKKSNPTRSLEREEVSIAFCMEEICKQLQYGRAYFFQLFKMEELTRERVVTTFLALLELLKQKRVTCYQRNIFGDIVVEYWGKGRAND